MKNSNLKYALVVALDIRKNGLSDKDILNVAEGCGVKPEELIEELRKHDEKRKRRNADAREEVMKTEKGVIKCSKHNLELKIKTWGGFKSLYCPKCQRNSEARLKNEILQDLCGTSARVAREDMGI